MIQHNRSDLFLGTRDRQLSGSDRLDDRPPFTACLRRFRAGGDFALRLHIARVANRAGRRSFAAVIRTVPTG